MSKPSRETAPRRYASREEQAHAEIGVTDVRRSVALLLVAGFVLLLAAGMASLFWSAGLRHDMAASFAGLGRDLKSSRAVAAQDDSSSQLLERLLAPNTLLRERIGNYEDVLNRQFPAAVALREPVQTLISRLGAGDEQVWPGCDGWLFYAADIRALTGTGLGAARPSPTAVASQAAIRQLHDFLAAHDVRLILLPIPSKAAVHPEKLMPSSAQAAAADAPLLRVRGFEHWQAELAAAGVEVCDPASIMQELRSAGQTVFLRSDTHWCPETMDLVAAQLADLIGPSAASAVSADPPRELPSLEVSAVGDTAAMLALPPDHAWCAAETVTIQPVAAATSSRATVALLGDSFANIFSLAEMGWGQDAGLAERLARHLARPVRPFVRNDGGARASREQFAQALRRGELDLTHLKVVVWQFAERELAQGDWVTIDWEEVSRSQRTVARALVAAQAVRLRGRIAAVSDGPRTDAPYADFIIKWHLSNLQPEEGQTIDFDELVVMTFGMRQRRIEPVAALRAGATVRILLQDWDTVKAKYEKLNAGSLDDPLLELDLPLMWADEVEVLQ